MTRSRPLPGIRFEGRTPPLRDAFPRMDIPVFVGLAASGPIDVPVAVEDPDRFTMIFGRDVVLPSRAGARDAASGHLASAVRAFFRNGGRRCWIVRVARREPAVAPDGTPIGGAQRNTFAVPGLLRLSSSGVPEPARLLARSEGSWSDSHRVRATLVGRPMALVGLDLAAPWVDVRTSSERDIAAGDLVRISWAGVAPALHLFVTSVESRPSSPAGTDDGVLRLSGRTLWLEAETSPAVGPSTLSGPSMAERLTMDLTVTAPGERPVVLSDLGFAPQHPRYLGALPLDSVLFTTPAADDGSGGAFRPRTRLMFASNYTGAERAPDAGWPGLWRDAALPRFALASEIDGAAYVPARVPVFPADAAGPDAPAFTALERDGLAVYDAGLFLDPELAYATTRDLLDRADAIRYRDASPRDLRGLHAALPVEEATMMAVPDAVHRGWEREIADPIASPLASSPLAHPEWWRWADCTAPPDTPPPAFSGFIDCAAAEPIEPPVLAVADLAGDSYALEWTAQEGAIDELEEALTPAFAGAVVIARGANGRVDIRSRMPGDYFYRIRRIIGSRTSDWSAGVAVRIASPAGWVALDSSSDAQLIDVQCALVRLCAALGDRMALLSLPDHFDESEAVAHASVLRTRLEPVAHSYGAVWHPWLTSRDPRSGELLSSPPEGATAGVMAARALARGAWIAPANEPIQGVIALDPTLPRTALQALQDAAVNVIRQEPSGFICLDADTLSGDDDVRPVNVRRLLILLRRAALGTGNRYVFEPNGERLRRAVKRGFEAMLEQMFARGAFAGRRAKDAFRVTTDASLNPPQGVEAGRFLAEIRVAPSRPLSFLTLRLLQRGGGTVVQEVR